MPRCQSFVAGMIFVALFYMKEKNLSEILAYLKANLIYQRSDYGDVRIFINLKQMPMA